MGDQGRGVQFARLNQPENFGAVAAVHAAGFEGQILSIHLRKGERLGFVIQGYYRHDGVGPGALPGQGKGVAASGYLQHHVRTAVIGVGTDKGFTFPGFTHQHLGIVLPDKGNPGRVFLTHNDLPWIFQQHTKQGADSRGPCPQNQHRVLGGNLRNPGGPEAGGQDVSHKQGLFICDALGNFVQSLVGVGHPHEFRLSAVNPAAQGPAPVGIGAVVDITMLAEKTVPAEGL